MDTISPKSDTRTRLIDAAVAALIAGQGNLEMGDVAKRAGVSGGLAYHYFGSKAGLLSAVITEFYDRYDAAIGKKYDPETLFAGRERQRLGDAIDFLYGDEAAPVVMGTLGGSAEVIAVEAARQDAMIAAGAKNIINAQGAGELDPSIDPEITSAAIIGGCRQALSRALTATSRPRKDELATHLWRFVAGALRIDNES